MGSGRVPTQRPADPGSEGTKGWLDEKDCRGTVSPGALGPGCRASGCSGLPGLRRGSPTAGKGKPESHAAEGVSCPGLGGQGQGLVKARHQAARKSPRVRPRTHRKVLLGERSGDPSFSGRRFLTLSPPWFPALLTRRDFWLSPPALPWWYRPGSVSDPGPQGKRGNRGGSCALSCCSSSFWLRQSVSSLLLNSELRIWTGA